MTPEQAALAEWLEYRNSSASAAHLSTFTALVEENERLKHAFLNYSEHKYNCALHNRKPCDCRLKETEKELGL